MVCLSIWVSKSLIGDKDIYDLALHHQDVAKSYWKVGFSPRFRVLPEDRDDNTYRVEDIVKGDELDLPKGIKLKNLFLSCIGDPPCYDDRMASKDSLRTVHVFYLNIEQIGESPTSPIGRTILYQEQVFIIMTKKATDHTFPHEFGHALYFTNNRLNGNDPISNKLHNDDPNNLMYEQDSTGTMILEQKQLDAKEYSYLTNPHVLHDTLPPWVGKRNFSIE